MMPRLAAMLLLWVFFSPARAQEIRLVANGRSVYGIVVPDEPLKAEERAAAELKKYLQLVCGVDVTIKKESQNEAPAIFIGRTEKGLSSAEKARIKDDGFCIATDSRDICIVGMRGQASAYGVYEFLEKYLGCRKYDQGPVSFKPLADVSVKPGLRDYQNPAFVYRQSYYPMSNDAAYLNWHRLHKFEDLWGLWGHSFFKLVSPDEYFKTHPEYFSLVNGKRQAKQLCLSNAAVLETAKKVLQKKVDENPDALYWSVSQMDGNSYCTCPQCAAVDAEEGGPQGSVIRFVNKLAAAFPQQQFTTLAYGYSADAPAKTRPAKNVIVMLSDIEALRRQPLATAPTAAQFRSRLEAWQAISPHIFVWDYTTQFTHYLAPFPVWQIFKPNLTYLRSKSVDGVFMQGSGDTYGHAAELNSYLQAKLLWNPGADAGAIKNDFINGYYGTAAAAVTDWQQALDASVQKSNARLDIYGNPVNDLKTYLPNAWLAGQANRLLSAENKTTGPLLKARVQRVRLSAEYALLQQAKALAREPGGYQKPDGTPQPGFLQRVEKFTAEAKAAGVTELSEGGPGPDAYKTGWEQLLKKPVQKSLAQGAAVTLLNPFSEDYPANKEKTLTDGLYGGPDYSFNWLFFYGTDMEATIDMRAGKDIREIRLNFLNDPVHNIFLPEGIVIETSADGKRFEPYFTDKISAPVQTEAASIRTFSAQKTVKARFIKVTAKCLPTMPAWRASAKKPALCCDEVMVF